MPATLTTATVSPEVLSGRSFHIGGFYPDSPLAYPDAPYPDEVTDGMLAGGGNPTPVTLTAA